MQLPEEVISALCRSLEGFVHEMRLAAAIHWYERGHDTGVGDETRLLEKIP
jgi:hypothetical protein